MVCVCERNDLLLECYTKDDIYRHCTLKSVIITNKFNEHETECINLLIMKLISKD